MLIFSTSFIFVVQPYIIIMTIGGQNMMEISTSNNNFYMDKFNKIIELKQEKENKIKKNIMKKSIYLLMNLLK